MAEEREYGLDEMPDDAFAKFQGDLQSFIRAFPETQIIMSSRPYTQWLNAIGGFSQVLAMPGIEAVGEAMLARE